MLQALAPIILAIVAAMTAWAGIMKVIDILSDLNPWTLAIMAVIAVVVLLVEHWKQVEDVARDVWHAVEDATDAAREALVSAGHDIENAIDAVRETFVRMGHDVEAAVDTIVRFIQAHWKLILASRPAAARPDHRCSRYPLVRRSSTGSRTAYNFVAGGHAHRGRRCWMDIIRPYIDWQEAIFRVSWDVGEGRLRGGVGCHRLDRPRPDRHHQDGAELVRQARGGLFRGWWDEAAKAVSSEIDKLMGYVEAIPHRINSALGGLPGMMFSAGVHVIESLLSGITSMIGSIGNVMGGIASKVAGFFGLSPAKEGPLSGGGAPEIRGQHFAADFARGMLSGQSSIASAAHHLAGTAGLGSGSASGGAGTAGSAGGTLTIQIAAGGGSGLEAQFWSWFKTESACKAATREW